MLALRKCCWWLTCSLINNIYVELNKADSIDLQQWLSFKFNVPTPWRNAFDYSYLWIYLSGLFAKIHHDFSTGTWTIGWLHIDSEVASKAIDEKTTVARTSIEAQKCMMLGVSDDTALYWDYRHNNGNRTKVTKTF